MPAMSAQDLDIIKLTARFAARNGRQFISQLAQRESRNFQFDFLRPSHSLFPYFTELIKQYSKVLVPADDIKEKLAKNASKTELLDRVKQRVEWTIWEEIEKKKRAEEDEKEKLAYASIEWHEFVVVETIEFTAEDERMTLPGPMSLQELERMSLAQKSMAALSTNGKDDNIPDFGAYERDLEKELGKEEEDVEMKEVSEKETEETPTKEEDTKDEPEPEQPIVPADVHAPIKIRTDYKPRILNQQNKLAQSQETQICPRCGERFPISELDEHMRIELLDPKWREQKLAQEAKLRDSNLLQEGTDVKKILTNFAGYRTDIFGAAETEIGKKIDTEQQHMIGGHPRPDMAIWDGHNATIQATQQAAQGIGIENQIAAIHRNKGLVSNPIDNAPTTIPTNTAPVPPPQTVTAAIPIATTPTTTINNNINNNTPTPTNTATPPIVEDATTAAIRKAEEEIAQNEAKRPRLQGPPGLIPPPAPPIFTANHLTPPVSSSNATPVNPNSNWDTSNSSAGSSVSIKLLIKTIDYPDKPEWNLNGETFELTDLPLNTLVSTVKDRITAQLGMPQGKQKLTIDQTVMNNGKSLGFYGCSDGAELQLGLKRR
ncbi:unnamed protein product [Cunninghamella blakesleeana]